MSISKSYNKQNGVTYVYEVYENYWNKEKKRPESRRRLIGKINPEQAGRPYFQDEKEQTKTR